MAKTPSTMLALGTLAPEFSLPNTRNGSIVSKKDYAEKALLVMFLCNHCPFVKHVRGKLAEIGRIYQEKGIGIVAISANDAIGFPEDSPEKMRLEAQEAGYSFPYLYDESQSTAKAYQAACTPDFFLFDKNHTLVYRGQLDGSRPGNGTPVTGKDLLAALEALLANKAIPEDQYPSLGCNIKWKSA